MTEANFDAFQITATQPAMKVPVKHWTRGVLFEAEAQEQLRKLASMPFIHRHLAVMPDVHSGRGSTVGTVIATRGAVIPAAVGVDIGCGMMAIQLPLKASDLPDSLAGIRQEIERRVPHGRTSNGQDGDRGAWHSVPKLILNGFWDGPLVLRYHDIVTKHPQILHGRADNHLGTLGTGNHFIEVCLDEEQNVWIMLHSGSRGPGNKIGTYFINLAREDMRRWFVNLPDQDLAYLPEDTEHFQDYWEAVTWAQDYASSNRIIMAMAVVNVFAEKYPDRVHRVYNGLDLAAGVGPMFVNCHHNYVTREHHFGENVLVTRKGAVRARVGDWGIIPGSMGAKSYIVRGLGNSESFQSCSHGAGRIMSRTQARKTFSLEDHAQATAGVECRKDVDVLDETPGLTRQSLPAAVRIHSFVKIKKAVDGDHWIVLQDSKYRE